MPANQVYGEDYNDVDVIDKENSSRMKDPDELMQEPVWMLYTFGVYLCFIEAIFLFVGGIVFTVHQVVNGVVFAERAYDIREEIVVVFFLSFSQVMVFHYGIKGRRELDSDIQERFRNFIKAILNLFTALILLYIKFCLNRNLIFVDSGELTICQLVLYILLGKFVVMKYLEGKAKKLDEYLKKHEALVRYQKSTHQNDGDALQL